MKRTLTLVLSLLMALTFAVPALAVIAPENSASSRGTDANVPAAVTEYAVQNVAAHYQLLNDVSDSDILLSAGIKADEEFADYDLYLFPVFANSKLNSVFEVCQYTDGTMVASLSKELNEGFNALLSSDMNKVSVGFVNGKLAAYSSEGVVALDPKLSVNEISNELITNSALTAKLLNADKDVLGLKNTISVSSSNTRAVYSIRLSNSYICREHQTGDSWCAAYVTAAALRHMKRVTNITVSSISSYLNHTNTSTAFSISELRTYCNSKGYTISNSNAASTMTETIAYNQLNNDRPIYASCSRSSSSHAVLIYGLNVDSDLLLVWDPTVSGTADNAGRTINMNTKQATLANGRVWTFNSYYTFYPN